MFIHRLYYLNHVQMKQDMRNCNPSLVSILGLEISTLGFSRNHMLGIDACTLRVGTEGSGALILELIIQLQCWEKVFASFLVCFIFFHVCYYKMHLLKEKAVQTQRPFLSCVFLYCQIMNTDFN